MTIMDSSIDTAKALAPDLGSGKSYPKHYPHVDRSGIPFGTWAENGLDRLAPRTDVAGVLGSDYVDVPVCLGVVDTLRNAVPAQLTSTEWWETLSAVNADVLESTGVLQLDDIAPALRLPE